MNDATMMAAIANRDNGAFELFVQRYGGFVYKVVRQYVHRRDRDDAMQDAYLRIWLNATKYDATRGTVVAWVGMMVRSSAADRYRKAERRKHLHGPIEHAAYVPAPERDTIEPTFDVNHWIVRRVPEVFNLYLRGNTQVHIAKSMNLPLGTVKTRMKRFGDKLKSVA